MLLGAGVRSKILGFGLNPEVFIVEINKRIK